MSSTPSVRRKSKSNPRRQQRTKEHIQPIPPFIYLVRLVICGLGVTTIAGTVISAIYPPMSPVTSKGKLPSPPQTKPPIPTNQPQTQTAIVPVQKKNELGVKPTPDSAPTTGFPKSVFIKPSTIRP